MGPGDLEGSNRVLTSKFLETTRWPGRLQQLRGHRERVPHVCCSQKDPPQGRESVGKLPYLGPGLASCRNLPWESFKGLPPQ